MTEEPPDPAAALPHPDRIHLEAAQGWLMLGAPEEALGELDRIAFDLQGLLPVLDARYDALAAGKRWEESLEIACRMLNSCPEQPSGWVKQSYALHELKRTPEARERLAEVEASFPKEWLIPYNLACYACQMGEEAASIRWLERAAQRGEPRRILAIALEDPDLEPLHPKLPGILRAKA